MLEKEPEKQFLMNRTDPLTVPVQNDQPLPHFQQDLVY